MTVMSYTNHTPMAFLCEEIYGIPPRSVLLSPEPIALGSSQAESLGSYFTRLVAANGLTVGSISYGKTLAPLAGRNADLNRLQRVARAFQLRLVTSTSRTGQELASVLARILGRPLLRRLHWGTSMEGFSFRYLTRRSNAWCHECLRTDAVPYVRMLWEMNQAVACPVHKRRLTTICNRCHNSRPKFGSNDLVRCSYCGCDYRSEGITNGASDDEVLISKRLGRLIAQVTSGDASARCSSSDCISALTAHARASGARTRSEQGHFLDYDGNTVSCWVRGDSAISLSSAIQMSLMLGIPLLEGWRREPSTFAPREPPINVAWPLWTDQRLTEEQKTSAIVRLATMAELSPPLAPGTIAARIGVTLKTLKRLAPVAYSRMLTRHTANKKRLIEARRNWRIAKIDRYISDCLEKKSRPTFTGVIRQFRKPGFLRIESYCTYTKQALLRAVEKPVARERSVDTGESDARRAPHPEPSVAHDVRCQLDLSEPAKAPLVDGDTNPVLVVAEEP
ncbi:TniQ family protein [Opitutus terrae]